MAVWPILACNFGAPFAITPKVYSDCDHAKRATLHLERHPGTSPHSLAQPVLALAHRDLHRRQDDTYRLSRVLGIPLAGASPTLALPEVDGRNGSLRSPKNEAGIVERVLRLTLKKPCLLHLFVLLSMVSGFAFSSLLQAQSSTRLFLMRPRQRSRNPHNRILLKLALTSMCCPRLRSVFLSLLPVTRFSRLGTNSSYSCRTAFHLRL